MKKLLVAALMTLVFSHAAFTRAAAYGGGSGTALSPYEIWTPQQMNTIGANPADWDKHFVLMDNIDMSIYTGTQYNIIGKSYDQPFTGTFNGNGHVIRNLTYATIEEVNFVGLFGLTDHATIQNLGVENVLISSRGNYVGGLVGCNESGSITACYATGSVSGTDSVGGLVGENESGSIISCFANVSVKSTGNFVGGLIGDNDFGLLTACYAMGSVSGANDYIGGLVGINGGTMTTCYAIGLVSGTRDYVGGLVGDNNFGSQTACFWDAQTSGQIIGVGDGQSEGIIGKTTAEMQMLSIFTSAGWDFVGESANGLNDYWQIGVNDYPRFALHIWTLNGEGTSVNPYIVSTVWDLGKVWLRPLHYYCLSGNLDLTGIAWSSAVIPTFAGVFEGQGNVISHLTINLPSSNNIGLFGLVDIGGCIRNLSVDNVHIIGCSYVGGLVGENYGSLVDCSVIGSISGIGIPSSLSPVGGLVGLNGGSLIACYAAGSVSGNYIVGGLVGSNLNLLMNCYTSGSVTGFGSRSFVGGLAGDNSFSTVQACYASASVTGTGIYSSVGGLMGISSFSTVKSCYANGSVDGVNNVGGLLGFASGGSLINCYASGAVSFANCVGGLIGERYYDTYGNATPVFFQGCFWDVQTCGERAAVGDQYPAPDGVTGVGTEEMQMFSTFTDAGWDFTNENIDGMNNLWRMCSEGVDYPRLNWESIDGDFACPEGVNIEDLDYYADWWLMNNCTPTNNYCGGADLNFSGTVDLADLSLLAVDWMKQ